MTSEILVMNKEAIALAADSTVTIGKGEKVFQTANKIFTLSKYHPVGIMVFGNANFMGIPWETIVKLYRHRIGDKAFPTIEEYASDFIAFLKKSEDLFPDETQKDYIQATITSYMEHLRGRIREKLQRFFSDNTIDKSSESILTTSELLTIVRRIFEEEYQGWNNSDFHEGCKGKQIDDIIKEHKEVINSIIEDVFEQLPLDKKDNEKLRYMAGSLFFKKYKQPTDIGSGVVIAGFGNKEVFPAMSYFTIQGLVNGFLPCIETENNKITRKQSSAILPLAQTKMVHMFMGGVHPDYDEVTTSTFEKLIEEFPEILASEVLELEDLDKDQRNRASETCSSLLKRLNDELSEYRQSQFINPILSVVDKLPKTELAVMAESLVSLTSLKRRVSPEIETVGGPVDVAVISKGDGFIWIKRKHYFSPELNPHFIENYFREG